MKAIQILNTLSNGSKVLLTEVTCPRCAGAGNFAHLSHINNGTCFTCNGTGVELIEVTVASNEVIEIVTPSTRKALVNMVTEASFESFVKERDADRLKELTAKVNNINEAMGRSQKAIEQHEEDSFNILDLLD